MQNLLLYPVKVWRDNEWHRLIASGLIHGNMPHLFFNMLSLYFAGEFVERAFAVYFGAKGATLFVIMYFGAIIVSDFYDLFKHKNNAYFASLGASGGVSAIIFALILISPFSKFYIPIPVPAFIYGPLFLIYSAYMAKRGGDHIGHAAHFTGAVFGFVFPILFEPRLLTHFINQLTGALH